MAIPKNEIMMEKEQEGYLIRLECDSTKSLRVELGFETVLLNPGEHLEIYGMDVNGYKFSSSPEPPPADERKGDTHIDN